MLPNYTAFIKFCADRDEDSYARKKFQESITSKNIAIHIIKKGMCDVCVGHQTGNVSDDYYQEHPRSKNRAREEKNRDA